MLALVVSAAVTPVGVADANEAPRAVPFAGMTPEAFDECQECDEDVACSIMFPTNCRASFVYFENDDGMCSGESCVRCNGGNPNNPGCDGNSGGEDVESESEGWDWLAGHSECGDCQGTGGTLLLTAVEKQVKQKAAADLAELITSSGGAVWLNQERGAIQAAGCGKRIGLHIPLSHDLRAAVRAELDRLI
jgi:hypothetical protein